MKKCKVENCNRKYKCQGYCDNHYALFKRHGENFLSLYNPRHGKVNTTEHTSWRAMIERCTNPNHKNYNEYMGRGLKVCDRWKQFINFLDDMGKKPNSSYTIERIDNSKGYYKENCKWATRKEQVNNRRYAGCPCEKNGSAKLTTTKVRKIKDFYVTSSKFTYGDLAKQFNVSRTTIGRIIRGESWNTTN